MAFSIEEASEQDTERMFEIMSDAFGQGDAFFNASWPEHWTTDGRNAGAKKFTEGFQSAKPISTYIKAVDQSDGTIVGTAIWKIMIDYDPDKEDDNADKKDDSAISEAKAYQQYLATQFFADRNNKIKQTKGNIALLDLLAVDPAHQRQGVAGALVKWGIDKADQLGLEIGVEASEAGQPVYEKRDFVLAKKTEIVVPPKWQDRGGQKFAWLVRPRQG